MCKCVNRAGEIFEIHYNLCLSQKHLIFNAANAQGGKIREIDFHGNLILVTRDKTSFYLFHIETQFHSIMPRRNSFLSESQFL